MFYWNPSIEFFRLPYFDVPIFWYGFFFALSFYVGYYLFLYLLTCYFYNFPEILPEEILDEKGLLDKLRIKTSIKQVGLLRLITKGEKVLSSERFRLLANEFIETEKNLENVTYLAGKQPRISGRKSLLSSKKAALRLFLERHFSGMLFRISDRADLFSDRLLTIVMAATIIGARLGYVFFYAPRSLYLEHPFRILYVWQGGLASHGGAVAVFFGVYLFARYLQPQKLSVPFFTVLDLITAPAAFIAGWIRIGNFFNQEILGKPTDLAWAVCFGRPMDGSIPNIPRHPVQLYESSFYFCLFFLLFFLATRTKTLRTEGKMAGLFLLFMFGFRFFIEQFKERQSVFAGETFLSMGQMLSIPLCFLGLFFLLLPLLPQKKKL